MITQSGEDLKLVGGLEVFNDDENSAFRRLLLHNGFEIKSRN